MIFHKTLKNIRKKHGFTQEEFAKKLGCTVEQIVAIESNVKPATYIFVTLLRDKLKLHNAPITESERSTLMNGLYNWKLAIDYADISTAKMLQPELEKSVRASYSPSAENFYDLYAADYYRAIGDMKAYEETMATLSQRTDEFSARHLYYYQRLVGARAFVEKRYQEAIKAYKKAEALDKNNEWHDVRFYFGMGMSLSDRGYATRAIAYLEKAKHQAMWNKVYNGRRNSRFDVYIDGYLASDLAKIGKIDDALKILDKRLEIEMGKNSEQGMGYTYFSFGRVYYRVKNYDKAIINYDKALLCLDVDSDAYIASLFQKAMSLDASNKKVEASKIAKKGLSITTDELWKTLFDALAHSTSLYDDPKSSIYLKETLIPKLLDHGQYEVAMYYYKQLSDFYYEEGNSDVALKYSNHAVDINELIRKDLIEGDM